jgi:hypothetical protein
MTTSAPEAIMSGPLKNIATDYGEGSSSCGYCESVLETSVSFGMQVNQLTVETYQDLLER